uniref:Uncharacterized protein n=1 Tax=Gopherus agassizii TaxID=38772 RepID=A0A452GQR9_9SAUR
SMRPCSGPGPLKRQRGELMSPSWVTGWEQMEETFVASSTGEGMELIDMVQNEDAQRLRNSVVKDLLLDLAISLNTGSIMLFFLCHRTSPNNSCFLEQHPALI